MKATMDVEITYPWTGNNVDTEIEEILGEEAHSSGCGLGKRDMQFVLPVDHNTLTKMRGIVSKFPDVVIVPDRYPCHFCNAWASWNGWSGHQLSFKCADCGAGRSVYPKQI